MESLDKSFAPINQWAPDDRPREKLLAKGKDALSDSELLAILIGTGSGKETALDLAKNILAACRHDLNELAKLSIGQLMKTKGIGPAKAITIVAAMELSRRRTAGSLTSQTRLRTSQDVAGYCQNLLRDHHQEVFMVIFLRTNNSVIDYKILFRGGMNMTVVDTRIIFQMALENRSTQIVLCHNHPSGNLNPSNSDIHLTRRIVDAGKVLDIKVVDHIIVSEQGYFSFADDGKLQENLIIYYYNYNNRHIVLCGAEQSRSHHASRGKPERLSGKRNIKSFTFGACENFSLFFFAWHCAAHAPHSTIIST